MFSIFKKSKPVTEKPDFSEMHTDMHSHLLPGIDDGSPDIETSLRLIAGMQELGFKKFYTTPHVMWDMYQNTPSTISQAYTTLQTAINNEQRSVAISPCAEYLLDDHFDEMLDKKESLLTFGQKLVLVEFSFVSMPVNYKEKLFNLQIQGYQPVLAHPERYLYFGNKKSIYDDLKSAGCIFQINLLSLTGYYGKGPQELATYLLSKKYVEMLGTDLHHDRHLDALQNGGAIMPVLKNLLDSGKLMNPQL